MPEIISTSGLGAVIKGEGNAAPVGQSDPSLTPLGLLVKLPPEIRLTIYEELIKAGSIAFLGTSSAVHNEAACTVHHKGIHNLEINVYKMPALYPSQKVADKISNLQLRVNLTDKSPDRNWGCIGLFNSVLDLISGYYLRALSQSEHTTFLPTPRKTCKILLDCHPSFVSHLTPQVFEYIRALIGFETLILAIANDTIDCTTRVRSLMYSARPDPRRQMDLALHGPVDEHTLRAYEMAKGYLEEKLGPAKWVCDERGALLKFHPRKFDRGHLTSLSNSLGISST